MSKAHLLPIFVYYCQIFNRNPQLINPDTKFQLKKYKVKTF